MPARVPEPVTASDDEQALARRIAVMVRNGEIRAASDRLATELQARYDLGFADGHLEGYSTGVFDGRREAEGRP